MTASEIVERFLAELGHPEPGHAVDGPFYLPRHGYVTIPKLQSLLWRHFRVSPRRADVADAYDTLLGLAADPEPLPEPLPQPETHSEEPERSSVGSEPVVVPTAPETGPKKSSIVVELLDGTVETFDAEPVPVKKRTRRTRSNG